MSLGGSSTQSNSLSNARDSGMIYDPGEIAKLGAHLWSVDLRRTSTSTSVQPVSENSSEFDFPDGGATGFGCTLPFGPDFGLGLGRVMRSPFPFENCVRPRLVGWAAEANNFDRRVSCTRPGMRERSFGRGGRCFCPRRSFRVSVVWRVSQTGPTTGLAGKRKQVNVNGTNSESLTR